MMRPRLPTGAVAEALEDEEIRALHQRCGVYTRPALASEILDRIGWTPCADLSCRRLLEPAAGDGVFIVEATHRLVASMKGRGQATTLSTLGDRIRAYELHAEEAEKARRSVAAVLRCSGMRAATAMAVARRWILRADFLLADNVPGSFTHVTGNPPYVRWSKIPSGLKSQYNASLPRDMIGGDLFLPFLDRSLELLVAGGRIGLVCSDRWQYMAFAERFRRKWLPALSVDASIPQSANAAFVRKVDAYASVLIATKRFATVVLHSAGTRSSRTSQTLLEAGYQIKVGPALGCTPAYVLEAEETDVEIELLQSWLDGSEIGDGTIISKGRRVVVMHDGAGKLLKISKYPRLYRRLSRYKDRLAARSIVRNGCPWYRPIDRLSADIWKRPKLLIPELAKVPRVALDMTGAIPSHGVYAIFSPSDDIRELHERLSNGGLARRLEGIAPTVKGGYTRCYRRFLERIVL